jgi:hypothetical protein
MTNAWLAVFAVCCAAKAAAASSESSLLCPSAELNPHTFSIKSPPIPLAFAAKISWHAFNMAAGIVVAVG